MGQADRVTRIGVWGSSGNTGQYAGVTGVRLKHEIHLEIVSIAFGFGIATDVGLSFPRIA